MTTQRVECRRCKTPVEILASLFAQCKQGVLCPACAEHIEKAEQWRKQMDRMRRRWLAICPPDFHNTVLDRLPRQEQTNKALDWCYQARGLNLWGVPQTGKTRTSWLILEREHVNGRRVIAFGPGEFAAAMAEHGFNASKWVLSVLFAYDLILFDDIDKLSLTVPGEKALFSLLDKRARYHRPVIYTGNANGEMLKTQFKSGEALVRRIRDFSQSIHFK